MTVGSEHWPNKRISSTLQKQINKKILKEQTEPQTYTLIVKKKAKCMNHTREESHYWECMTIHGKAPTTSPSKFKPCNLKTMGAPDFSKNWTIVLNFHTKIINTLIPVCQQTTKNGMSNARVQQIIFSQHSMIFRPVLIKKKFMLTCKWWLQ